MSAIRKIYSAAEDYSTLALDLILVLESNSPDEELVQELAQLAGDNAGGVLDYDDFCDEVIRTTREQLCKKAQKHLIDNDGVRLFASKFQTT